jgi:hypothetical protein
MKDDMYVSAKCYDFLQAKYHDILDSHHHLEWEYNKQRERIKVLEDALSYVLRVEGVVLRLDTYDMLQELVGGEG